MSAEGPLAVSFSRAGKRRSAGSLGARSAGASGQTSDRLPLSSLLSPRSWRQDDIATGGLGRPLVEVGDPFPH